MPRRALVLGLIVAGGFLGCAAPEPPPEPPPVPPIEKIADNLYLIPNRPFGATAVYVAATGVVLVDTGYYEDGQRILEQVRAVTDKPITMIINTHAGIDHVGSNSFFPANVEIVAHENTKANMEVLRSLAFQERVPDRTFKDRLTVLGGTDAIDLYYFGPAKTNGDTFVVFRNDRVMHAGDVFEETRQPIIDTSRGGSRIEYPETIAKAVASIKNVDTVMTGHTDVKTWQEFVDYGEYTRLFVQHARQSLEMGRTPEQAQGTLQLPDKFKRYTNLRGRGGPGGSFAVIYEELKRSGTR